MEKKEVTLIDIKEIQTMMIPSDMPVVEIDELKKDFSFSAGMCKDIKDIETPTLRRQFTPIPFRTFDRENYLGVDCASIEKSTSVLAKVINYQTQELEKRLNSVKADLGMFRGMYFGMQKEMDDMKRRIKKRLGVGITKMLLGKVIWKMFFRE